jgi:GNAT superfamily N-acetyltransferase
MSPASKESSIIPISDEPDRHARYLSAACELHRTLRPNLPDDYEAYMRRMFAEGAEMAILTVDGVTKSIAVYRCHHTTFHGLRFYMDDLVTTEAERGQGYGRTLLAWCEERARMRGCDSFDLESGVQRPRTHQFYFREGLTIFAFGFAKALR